MVGYGGGFSVFEIIQVSSCPAAIFPLHVPKNLASKVGGPPTSVILTLNEPGFSVTSTPFPKAS
jgi:hypothetical protein